MSTLSQSLIDTLNNSTFSFWNYYSSCDDVNKKWIDLTSTTSTENHSAPKQLFAKLLEKNLDYIEELSSDEVAQILKYNSAMKELSERVSSPHLIRVFKYENYVNTYGGGAGGCEVIVYLESQFVLHVGESGQW